MNTQRTYHVKPNPQTAEDFPTIEQVWERMAVEMGPNVPDQKKASLKLIFMAGFSSCLELHMDIGLLPSETEAFKVLERYVREVAELKDKATQDLARLMTESLEQVAANAPR